MLTTLAVAPGCERSSEEAREDEIASVLARFDEPVIRARPGLAATKFEKMASRPFDFLRGSLPLYRHDARMGTTDLSASRFALDYPLVPSLGDPHVENFGALVAGDGTLGLEPNDFDAADHAPYLWDLRRLASSTALGVALANPEDEEARDRTSEAATDIVRAAVLGYRRGIERAARGERLERVVSDGGSALLADLLRRANRDARSRAELEELTVFEGDARRLRRGGIDPDDPGAVYVDLPASALRSLPAAIETWRRSLVAPPPAEHVRLLDAVRELGGGVASLTRVRGVLLVRGPTDAPEDDVVLELKELGDSGIAGLYPPGVYHGDVGSRVRATSRAAWARPDAEALWGTTTWLGAPFQIRLESEAQKSVRVDRFVDDEGTVASLTALASVLGEIVARVHTSSPSGTSDARAIYARIAADPEGFVDEQVDVAVRYAARTLEDHARFRRALARLGPRLGVPFDPADAPRPDLAALLAAPPSVPSEPAHP